ncbi:MAG: outer membrane protein transport protein [Myxococcota bacterium]
MGALHRCVVALGLAFAMPAAAAGLDEPQVGGVFGSAAATNPSAVFWNPAGLAAARGTRFLLDLSPTFRRMTIDRPGPARPGPETFTDATPAPFVGLASDFGVKRVGVGFALFVPASQRWASTDAGQTLHRDTLRSVTLRLLQIALAGSYDFGRGVSIGVSASVVDSRQAWTYDVPVVDGTDATVTTDLEDQATTFGVGLYLRPYKDPRLGIAVSYNHGFTLNQQGLIDLAIRCPGESPCGTTPQGLGGVALTLPSRVHAGIKVRPVRGLRLEAFGTWVGWSRHRDAEVTRTVAPDAVEGEDAAAIASALTSERRWARDLRDTFRAVLDAKFAVNSRFTVGVRAGFDQAAVPTAALSPINADADTVRLSGLGLFRPSRSLQLGVSYGQDLAREREVTESAFGLDGTRANRYRYPETQGRYTFRTQRVGLIVKGTIGPR